MTTPTPTEKDLQHAREYVSTHSVYKDLSPIIKTRMALLCASYLLQCEQDGLIRFTGNREAYTK